MPSVNQDTGTNMTPSAVIQIEDGGRVPLVRRSFATGYTRPKHARRTDPLTTTGWCRLACAPIECVRRFAQQDACIFIVRLSSGAHDDAICRQNQKQQAQQLRHCASPSTLFLQKSGEPPCCMQKSIICFSFAGTSVAGSPMVATAPGLSITVLFRLARVAISCASF